MRPAKRWIAAASWAIEPVSVIPMDRRRGPTERARALRAVRWLWSRGFYPGPAAMSLRLYGHATATVNSVATTARREVMQQLGIPLQRRAIIR